jgi:serine/threonine-protein kinase
MVGPWRILESLGTGAMGHAFKVEQDGHHYVLKMAVRPTSAAPPPGEEDVDRRLGHEAAFLLAHDSHPGVLRVVEVGRWPHVRGYRFFVTEYVEGDTFHEWRGRVRPSAAKLLGVFTELTRLLRELHRRGVHHRDLKADNLLVRRKDERPFLLDFGSVHLPGASTLTVGLPPGTPHALPPEALAFVRGETWRKGARFSGGETGDLYALGVLLYESLTNGYPFDPLLPTEQLVTAIETVAPPAPHELVPEVPRPLSDIAMRLLAKSPDERYANAEELLRALWEAAKEQRTPAWKTPLPIPPEGPFRLPERKVETTRAPEEESSTTLAAEQEAAPSRVRLFLMLLWAFTPRRVKWLVAFSLAITGLLLALWLGRTTLAPSHPLQKGSAPVSTHTVPSAGTSRLFALLCATAGLGCPGAQVQPPRDEACPQEAKRAMREVLKLDEGAPLKAIIDVTQPGDQSQEGTYRDGSVVGQVVAYSWTDPGLPSGTLLYGQLWTGTGITLREREAVAGRYTKARLPDGRTLPVCIVLGDPGDGRIPKLPGSKPGAAQLPRELPVSPVYRWP